MLVHAALASMAMAVTTPYPGVTHEKHVEGAQRFHLVTIDLMRPPLSMHVSSEANRGQRLSEIAKREKAVIAVNGQIFRTDFSLCGIAVSRGVPWTKVDDASCNHAIGWNEDARTWNAFSAKGLAKGPATMPVAKRACGCGTAGSSAIPPFFVLGGIALTIARRTRPCRT